MDRWLLTVSTLLALIGGISGMCAVHHGHRSRMTLAWMAGCFALQAGFLYLRGQARSACPLGDLGEILAFLAWSLTLFYILVGRAYRLSLLGVFSAPVVMIIQSVVLFPGVLSVHPARRMVLDPWKEMHSATSVLAYGGLALAAIAGVMFLTLDRQLKAQHLKSGLFRNLPNARTLLISQSRLLWLGTILLTIGIAAGLLTPFGKDYLAHLVAASIIWSGYVVLLIVKQTRGLTGGGLSWSSVILFLASLVVFALI